MLLLKHLKTVFKHKYHVFKACLDLHMPIVGILHDMSKLSPSEIYLYQYYTNGMSSTIEREKKLNGYSIA